MEKKLSSKYHRKTPIREFDVNQTLYSLVKNANRKNMGNNYAHYLGNTITFAELLQETDQLAAALHNDGVTDKTIVGVCLLTVPEVAPVLLAINKLGAVSYWIDASIKPIDMLHYICEYNLKMLFVYEPLVPVIASILSHTQLQRIIVVAVESNSKKVESTIDSKFVCYRDYVNIGIDDVIHTAQYDKDKPTVIVQSSGSTGASKSIVHTDFNFNSAIIKMAYLDLPFYSGMRSLVCAPPWIIYGLVNSIYASLVLGCETVFTTEPREDMISNHLGLFDYVFGVPVYYRYLFDKMVALEKSTDEKDVVELIRMRACLDRVKVFISGGDKASEEEIISWQLMFRVPVVNGYGNNEVVGAIICSPMFANRPGSIGVPLYGTIVKTFSTETGEMLPDGEIGELCISTDSQFIEYIEKPEETALIKKCYDGKDWVHTGDLAYVDKDGFVYLQGRTRRLIIDKLGYKISPDNSENFIMSLPYVRECVVVGVEIAKNDTVPMAFVALKEEYKSFEQAMAEIEKACKNALKEYEQPKFFKQIDSIPHKQNSGKQDFLLLERMAKEIISNLQN